MIEDFCKRINLEPDNLSQLAKIICQEYNLGKYIAEELILVGYEDFNFKLITDKGKYCVKIFHKNRTPEDIKAYIDRIKLANTLKINTPKIHECHQGILCKIKFAGVDFQLCVFEYIDGKSFYDLCTTPTEEEIKNIIFQMAQIHSTKLNSQFIYDSWAIMNFAQEYAKKEKALDDKYRNIFGDLAKKLQNVKLEELPTSFVHGDIISSNVLKDKNGKLWIIDFATSNYLPRIVDLAAVAACNLCLRPNDINETIRNTKLILTEYQNYNKLTQYERECFPLFYDLANAMGVLQISYLSTLGEISQEDKFWLAESEKGLSFSSQDFWNQIL